jgi:DNA polymerase elongation subunit (family B)
LANAINLANSWGKDSHGKWRGIEVVYGDTDSIFIKLPGRTIKQAFDFGEEFCKSVTARNPPPVQLKLEKVYAVTLLQTVSPRRQMILKHRIYLYWSAQLFSYKEKEVLRIEIRLSRAEKTRF